MAPSRTRSPGVDVSLSFGIGAAAGATSKTFVAPLERIRLLMQTQAAGGSASHGLRSVLQAEGALGLWRGNGLAVTRATLQKGTLFATQDKLAVTLSSDTLAGGAAGLTAGALTYPLDLLRTRVAGAVRGNAAQPTPLSQLVLDLLRREGATGFYRGAPATMAGAIAYEGMRFGLFGKLRDAASAADVANGADPAARPGVLLLTAAGVFSSLVAGNVRRRGRTPPRRCAALPPTRRACSPASPAAAAAAARHARPPRPSTFPSAPSSRVLLPTPF